MTEAVPAYHARVNTYRVYHKRRERILSRSTQYMSGLACRASHSLSFYDYQIQVKSPHLSNADL